MNVAAMKFCHFGFKNLTAARSVKWLAHWLSGYHLSIANELTMDNLPVSTD